MAIHDPVIHPSEVLLSSQLETTSNEELEPNNTGDTTAINDSVLQSTYHTLNTNSSNANATTQQLDIAHDSTVSDITPVNISETHDCIVSASNLSEVDAQSDFNTSLMSNDHAEPGTICFVCNNNSLAVENPKAIRSSIIYSFNCIRYSSSVMSRDSRV